MFQSGMNKFDLDLIDLGNIGTAAIWKLKLFHGKLIINVDSL